MLPLKLASVDGLTLDAAVHPAEGISQLGTVVQAHGITADMDEGGMFVRLAERLAGAGFTVLRFSFRGHGNSQGTQRVVTIAGELLDLQVAIERAWQDHGGPLSPRHLRHRHLIPVLRGLHAELDGDVTLIWDNLSAHISAAMRAWVAGQDWLETVRLPSYAPESNPVECRWSTLKSRDLAGHACRNVDELLLAAQVGVIRIRREPELLWGFLRHTGLPLNDFIQLPKDQ